VRTYIDTKGIGFFDGMELFENDIQTTYLLDGFYWKQIAKKPYGTLLKDYENTLLSVYGDQSGHDVNITNENANKEVDAEQIDTNESLDKLRSEE